MTDEELVKAAKEAREALGKQHAMDHKAFLLRQKILSRRLFDLIQEAARREIDMCRIFGNG